MTFKLPDGVRWWALATRANFEHTVEEQLVGRGIETYLPTFRTFSRRTDRKKIISLPLFPGYLFFHTNLSEFETRVGVVRCRGVVRIVGGPDGPLPVQDAEVLNVKTVCGSERLVEPWGKLEVGTTVRVVSGGLTGVTGVIVEIKGKGKRLVCNVVLLGRAVAAELSADEVEEINRLGPIA